MTLAELDSYHQPKTFLLVKNVQHTEKPTTMEQIIESISQISHFIATPDVRVPWHQIFNNLATQYTW